jgi:hypothetical protein
MEGLITSEQVIFADAVKRFAAQEYGTGPAPHGLAFDPARLQRLAGMGCLSLAIPEAMGGFGGPLEAMVAMTALGPALPPEPVVASGIHAACLIAAAAAPDLAQRLLAGIAEGSIVAVVADIETDGRYDRSCPGTTARAVDGSFVLDGAKSTVPFGDIADVVVVSAMLDGGVALFAVEGNVAGLTRNPVRRLDGLAAADLAFSAMQLPASARLGAGAATAALERAADLAIAAQIAEMLGLMEALIAATVDYARTRRQFGVAIGSFQALQHRIADMWIACEETRSMAVAAAYACSEDTARTRTISAAMLTACDAARKVGADAIQIHGGIGMTDELIVGHWYRRLWALSQELGDRRSHLARLTA